jgi:Na+-transporting methylmalonyl-CoA/oxaloacetate decarboxylase gamma subunit
MYLRTFLIIVVVAIVGIFAVLNWGAFTSPTTLSIGFTTVEAPLGLILLGVTGVLALLFLIYLVYLQSSALVESRRYARELQLQRETADNAEASRYSQLQLFLKAELERLGNQTTESKSAVLARLDQLEGDLRSRIEQSGNSLAASIGEFEDRFERSIGSGKT